MYAIEDLVKLARRENNRKRQYLYVNPLQGKYMPANPQQTKEMCKLLAESIYAKYSGEKLCIIGFAETATAIAAYTAGYLPNVTYFEHTTREILQQNVEYLYFTESHSHATEQKLNILGLENIFSEIDRIVFVEDEVTTGNTICKLIQEIQKRFPNAHIQYGIASVLNSMSEERLKELQKMQIECIFLKKLPFEYKIQEVMNFDMDKNCMYEDVEREMEQEMFKIPLRQISGCVNARFIHRISDYAEAVKQLCEDIYRNEFQDNYYEKILVIGTEECMYPAIETASYLKEKKSCKEAVSHSTTRGPVIACQKENYPLYNRYKIKSLYEEERSTYIYNLKKYDKVVVVTDTWELSKQGLKSLYLALKAAGNEDISVYQWMKRNGEFTL